MRNMYEEAIGVQNASNLSGVAHTFADVMQQIWDEVRANNGGTGDVNKHPVTILFLDKMNSLAGIQPTDPHYMDAVSAAYRICADKVGG